MHYWKGRAHRAEAQLEQGLDEASIRADEREALKAENWTVIMREGCLVTWGDAEELGERVRAVIKARGDV